ncbi:MAG: DUF349 domain-containing protein, partial [Gammaproteobacteria bacterium]
MFSRFFKPRWKSSKAATRVNAVAGLDFSNSEDNRILKKLARTDVSEEVCVAAINAITDVAWLSTLLASDIPDAVKRVAKNRVQSLTADQASQDEAATQTALDSISDANSRLAMAATSENKQVRETLLSKIEADDELISVISDSKYHDVRLAAVKKLKSPESIETAYCLVKNKDKVAARFLHEHLLAYKTGRQESKAHDESVARILASMDALTKSQWSAEFTGRYLSLNQRWEKLTHEISAENKQQFQQSEKIAADIVATHQNIVRSQQQQNELVQKLPALSQQVMALSADDLEAGLKETESALANYEQQWNAFLAISSPEKKLSEAYHRQLQALRKLHIVANNARQMLKLSAADESLSEPEMQQNLGKIDSLLSEYKSQDDSKLPEFIKQISIQAGHLRQLIKTEKNTTEKTSQAVNKQFRSLQAMLSTGKWGPANSIYQRLLTRINALDETAKKPFVSRLANVQERLNEIGDWKSFATAPKLEGLCEQMEAVPEMDLNPGDRADWIKKLQGQWKSMGSSPESNNLWPRFKVAADKAYIPCAEHFDKKRQQREHNLETRRQMCDQLQTYFDSNHWSSPDWKLVQKTQRLAKQEWSKSRIVDRKAGKALDDRFTELMHQFDEKLAVEYVANAAEKQGLIDKVTALADGEVNQHALNQVKRYQLAWKQVGIMRRNEDQVLWETFNETCRKVYNASREIQQQEYAKSIAHVTEAKNILKEMNMLARQSENNEKLFSELQDKFQALPDFPDRDKKYLER